MFNKRGDLEIEMLGRWLIVIAGGIVILVSIYLLKEKIFGAAEFIKNLLGWR